MGWDAFTGVKTTPDQKKIEDPKLDAIFERAHAYAVERGGAADYGLRTGWLDTWLSGHMLHQATGEGVYTEEKWQAAVMYKKANWDFPVEKEHEWAYWSARAFLYACKKANLTISFSW